MRIVLVTPGFSANEDDWCIPALSDLVRGLAAEHQVLVVTLRYPEATSSYRVRGAKVVPLGGARTRGWRRIPFLLHATRRLEQEVERFDGDLLHALWAHEPGFLAARVAARLQLPCLVSLLGGELAELPDVPYGGELETFNRHLTRFALARADLVTSGSHALDTLAATRVPEQRRRVIPLGVDRKRFTPHGSAADLSGRPVLLRVGSLSPVKDPWTALEALLRLRRFPDAHLHFVGDGELRHPLARRAEELGLAPRVVLHGDVRHDLLPPFYRAADLCISSSRFESQAMVLLEALACGKITVGSAVGLLPELADTGSLAPPADGTALAMAIERGLETTGASSRSTARELTERFDLERTLVNWMNVYTELCR